MIDHVSIAVRDLEAAARFYDAVLGPLGLVALERRRATVGYGKTYPEFWINLRADTPALPEGHGAHVCFRARSPELVDAFHAAALTAGGDSDGAPVCGRSTARATMPPLSAMPTVTASRRSRSSDSDQSFAGATAFMALASSGVAAAACCSFGRISST